MKFFGLGHINIVVDNISKASDYYSRILGAIPTQEFPHFKNIGFAKSAGFMNNPDSVSVTIRFMEIPGAGVFLELMEYHSPRGEAKQNVRKTNDIGGVGHICLRVNNIDSAFDFIKKQKDATLISLCSDYKPYQIDNITPAEFNLFNNTMDNELSEKEKVCRIVGNIRYFYFVDIYGIQWEFEEGHIDIGGNIS